MSLGASILRKTPPRDNTQDSINPATGPVRLNNHFYSPLCLPAFTGRAMLLKHGAGGSYRLFGSWPACLLSPKLQLATIPYASSRRTTQPRRPFQTYTHMP